MIDKSATHNHHFFKITIAQGKAELHMDEKHNNIGIRAVTLEIFMQLGREFKHERPKNVGVENQKIKLNSHGVNKCDRT